MSIFSGIWKREAGSTPTQGNTKSVQVVENTTYASGRVSSLTVPAFYRGVGLLSETMAQMVVKYQRRDEQGSCYVDDFGPTRGAKLNWLVQKRPNPYMNWVTLCKLAETRRIILGNAYIWIERDYRDEVAALWLCDSATVVGHQWQIQFYQEDRPVTMSGISGEDIIHIKNTYTTADGVYGISTLAYLKRTLDTSATLDSLIQSEAAKGGARKIVVQEEGQKTMGMGKVNQKEAEKATEQLRTDFATQDIIYLNNALGLHDFSYSPQELCIDVLKKATVLDVARVLGIAPILLMDNSASNYKTPESATLELYRTLATRVREWEDEFDTKVLGESEYGKHRFHMCEDGLFRLDRNSQADFLQKMVGLGVYSPNEVRGLLELPRLKDLGADGHYLSTNLALVGSAKLTGEGQKQVK